MKKVKKGTVYFYSGITEVDKFSGFWLVDCDNFLFDEIKVINSFIVKEYGEHHYLIEFKKVEI